MSTYPVTFDVGSPSRYERIQVVLRLALAVVMGLLGISAGWIFLLVYLALPAAAAIMIQGRGAQGYLDATAPSVVHFLRWLLSFGAYLAYVTDRFPTTDETLVRLEIAAGGAPTPTSALGRLLASLPEAIVLALYGVVSSVLGFVAMITVLVARTVPAWIVRYQRGFLRFAARWLAYHASIVEPVPPFALDTGTAAA